MRTVMKTTVQRGIRAVVLVGLLGCSGWVVAQTMPEPRTSDGRAFSALSEEERKAQPFADRIAYNKWQLSRLEAEAKAQDERIARLTAQEKRLDEENARLTEQINAVCLSTTASFRKLHDAGNRSAAYIEVKNHLKKAVVQNQSYLKDCLDPINADAKLKAAILE